MKLPYGISDFRTLISEGRYYVDKTSYISMLEAENEPFQFLLRPRRFGKSLWISTLYYYYDRKFAPAFSDIFGNLNIGKAPTAKANNYHVLRFEFSRIDTSTPQSTKAGFRENVLKGIRDFEDHHDGARHDYSEYVEPADVLKRFLSEHKNKNIFLLIDEYDHFANEILSFRFDDFSRMVTGTGFVRKFYETIKEGTGVGIINRMFATGVTPITLDSLTSGFNIAMNFTIRAQYNEIMGFTEEELEPMLQVAGQKVSGCDMAEISRDLRNWYNGYLFGRKSSTRVYNPDMVLFFMNGLFTSGEYPSELVDMNIASDYGKIRRFFDIKNRDANYEVLDALIRDKSLIAKLTPQFSFERPFTRNDFISLLFYMGFVSIKDEYRGAFRFRIPNFVIESLYLDYFWELLQTREKLELKTLDIENAFRDLAWENRPEPFLGLIEAALKGLSNRDMRQFDEKYIKVLFVTFANLAEIYFVRSDVEVARKYPDVMFLERAPHEPEYEFVFEIKYLKKADAGSVDDVTAAAEKQLRTYLDSDLLANRPKLKAYVVVFTGCQISALRPLD